MIDALLAMGAPPTPPLPPSRWTKATHALGRLAIRAWRTLLVLSLPVGGWILWFSHPAKSVVGKIWRDPNLFPTAALVVAAWLLLLIWRLPKWQVAAAEKRGSLGSKDAADLEDAFRKTFAQIVAGIGAAGALYFTYQANESAKDKQLTDQYAKAVEQLGTGSAGDNKQLPVRLGGIYSLARIADISEKDHWPCMEVLTAYVRKNAPRDGTHNPPLTEIRAILTVIRQRKLREIEIGEHLDLSDTALESADLDGADLTGADLAGANLTRADLAGAHLHGANLDGAHLNGAHLDGANLDGANLHGAFLISAHLDDALIDEADLAGAHLHAANLAGAFLAGAHLTDAELDDAILTGAHLHSANLTGANLRGANLARADLHGADLDGADLDGADLTRAHLDEAHLDDANLTGAHLDGANLTGAHLDDAHFDGVRWFPSETGQGIRPESGAGGGDGTDDPAVVGEAEG
jgi:uncharacterized protein YjbI with pentapeptide repeats